MERSNTAAIVVGVGLLLGAGLGVLTFLVARYGPSGENPLAWSLRGNGALIVPFGLGPAVLAGGWTALLLHGRPGVRWLAWGVAVFAVDAVLVLLSVLAFAVGGNAGLANLLLVVVVVSPLIAPVGLVVYLRRPQRNSIAHFVAQVGFTVSGLVGFAVAGRVLPPGS